MAFFAHLKLHTAERDKFVYENADKRRTFGPRVASSRRMQIHDFLRSAADDSVLCKFVSHPLMNAFSSQLSATLLFLPVHIPKWPIIFSFEFFSFSSDRRDKMHRAVNLRRTISSLLRTANFAKRLQSIAIDPDKPASCLFKFSVIFWSIVIYCV